MMRAGHTAQRVSAVVLVRAGRGHGHLSVTMTMHAENADAYAALGLDSAATQDEITRAYRSLLRRHHPDTRPQPTDASQRAASDAALARVIAAHALLGDPARRAAYDRQHSPIATRPHPRASAPVRGGADRAEAPIVAGPVWWDPYPHRNP